MKNAIKKAIEYFCESDQFHLAIQLSGMLSPEEALPYFKVIRMFCVRSGRVSTAKWAAEMMKECLTDVEVQELFDVCWNKGYFGSLRQVAAIFVERNKLKEVESLLANCVDIGQFDLAREAARLLGRDLTTDELYRIIATYRGSDNFRDDYPFRVVLALPEPARSEELIRLTSLCFREGFVSASMEGIMLLGDKCPCDILDKCLAYYVERGMVVRAEKIAGFLGRDLSLSELQTILAVYLKNEEFIDACEFVFTFPEEGRIAECRKLFAFFMGRKQLDLAMKIARRMPEPHLSWMLKLLLEDSIAQDRSNVAAEAAGMILGRR